MKVWIVSDLHTNSQHWVPERIPEHDVMVIAGDLADSVIESILRLHEIAGWHKRPVVFVPGNHDHFGSTLHAWDSEKPRLLARDVYVLSCGQVVDIDGTRFVGATLWTDWHLTDSEWASQSEAARSMSEYQHVKRPAGGLIWPIDTSNEHDVHRSAIEAVLRTPHFGPTVVVTHHAPSSRSIRGLPQVEDAAFASNLEPLIWEWQPDLWVHGHVHHASDYRIGSTRMICNPRGYVRPDWSEHTGWQEDLVIDV